MDNKQPNTTLINQFQKLVDMAFKQSNLNRDVIKLIEVIHLNLDKDQIYLNVEFHKGKLSVDSLNGETIKQIFENVFNNHSFSKALNRMIGKNFEIIVMKLKDVDDD
jgi:nitrogen fixation/metabolism regulation signal transduction histidine kinase